MNPAFALPQTAHNTCLKCNAAVDAWAKFCHHCGTHNKAQQAPAQKAPPVPAFVFLKPQPHTLKDEHLQNELSKVKFFIAREYFFLGMHWSIFAICTIVGAVMAWQCWVGFEGDWIEKFLVAMTPIMWINLASLACIVYVKKTEAEMARLRERMSYVKFKIEYNHVLSC